MLGEHHTLTNEFPEYREQIRDLKATNPHFAKLFDEYDNVDKAIYRIEEQIETPSDDYTESLKKQRVALKDQLFALLKQAARSSSN